MDQSRSVPGTCFQTDVHGVFQVIGARMMSAEGWVRRDAVMIGDDTVGVVEVREFSGALTSTSRIGDRSTAGRDIDWIVRECGVKPPAPAAPAFTAAAPVSRRGAALS